MPHFLVDLPRLDDAADDLTLRTTGSVAFIRSPSFIARLSLESGDVAWAFERPQVQWHESIWALPRRIDISGSDIWRSEALEVVAELSCTEDGGAVVSARCAKTGRHLWDHPIPIPDAAAWAEPSPAWPGAQTEEIHAFLANDSTRLIVCILRHSRRTLRYSPEITVNTLPPFACQLDAIRLDISTGVPVWRESFPDVAVRIIERRSFTGIWSTDRRVGVIDFETGTNRVLHEFPHAIGWPVHDASLVAVPWHTKADVGIAWLDVHGNQARRTSWRQTRVRVTYLHHTGTGLALQANDQSLSWVGQEGARLWTIRAKPYIYRVHCCRDSDVFVGTDGGGGRLLAFDSVSGEETLNVKPLLGSAGTLAIVPALEVLVARFSTSRRDEAAGKLFVLSMRDRTSRLDCTCRELLGTWQHGAVCIAGKNGESLAIVDLR